jgi:hypothetical protein
VVAAELLGKGYKLWRPYIKDLPLVIRRLLSLSVISEVPPQLIFCSLSIFGYLSIRACVCVLYVLFLIQASRAQPSTVATTAIQALVHIGMTDPRDFFNSIIKVFAQSPILDPMIKIIFCL